MYRVVKAMAVTSSARGVVLAATLLAATACPRQVAVKGPSGEVREGRDGPAARVVTCKSAIVGEADPLWRQRSTVVGNLGFYGPERDFSTARRSGPGWDLVTKIPVIVEGASGATVSVPPEERSRVALLFGSFQASGRYRVRDGYAEVRFEPCTDRERTGWPGGLVLRDRREVRLEVRLDGVEPVAVTLGTLPPANP